MHLSVWSATLIQIASLLIALACVAAVHANTVQRYQLHTQHAVTLLVYPRHSGPSARRWIETPSTLRYARQGALRARCLPPRPPWSILW